MTEPDSQALLDRYLRDGSEAAFRELVSLHAPLVRATALRKLNGDAAAADDVAQEVFTRLARKGGRLKAVVLGGWLYRQTCRLAANHIRAERRRKRRERIAMEMPPTSTTGAARELLARELDDALLSLPAAERDALVLWFLEGRAYATVGKSLGVSEEAARKRVSRALEKLAARFQRQGITAVSVGLAGTLSGFSAPAVPPAWVSRISARAVAAAPATSAAVLPLVKSLGAGALAGSLVTVPLLAVQKTAEVSSAAAAGMAEGPARGRVYSRVRPYSGNSSLEGIIRQLKQIQSGPAHVLTSLWRDALLERIAFSQIPEFMALAKDMLLPLEKAAIYEPLLERWAAEDPDDALDFVLREEIVNELNPITSTHVLVNLFDDWSRRDLHGAKDWLLRHWSDEKLARPAFLGTTRSHLAQEVAQSLFVNHGPDALAGFVARIPDEAGKAEAVEAIAVNSPYTGQVQIRDNPELRAHALEFLGSLPESLRPRMLREFGKSWAESHPEELLKTLETADKRTRFDLSLGRLATRSEPGTKTPTPGGGYIHSPRQVTDVDSRAQQAIEAGLDAGLSRAEVLPVVAEVLVDLMDEASFFEWMDRHADDADFQNLVVEWKREAAMSSSYFGSDYPGLVALRWAARISDPNLRIQLSRASFRQLLAKDQVKRVPDNLDLSPDVMTELQRILEVKP